ncbi:MAG: hypothetical protein R3E32_26725 [Chitinophagales bacterium]
MAYLYLTKNYERKYHAKYGKMLEPHFEKIRNSENPQSFIEQYEHSPIWKMNVGERTKYRLILQKVTILIEGVNYEVFCMKGVILRGAKDYKEKNWKYTIHKWMQKDPIDEDTLVLINEWLKQQIADAYTPPPPPPDSLIIYTTPINNIHLSKSDIYESQEWITSVKQENIHPHYEEIRELIDTIHEDSPCCETIEDEGVFKLSKTENLYIVHAQFELPADEENQAQKIAFLLDVFTDDSKVTTALYQTQQKYPYTYDTPRERLMQDCKRAYDSYLVCSKDLWAKIEQDEKANLVLSHEERTILRNPTFPLFINGQAGSGKSTVLYYIFAHFYAMSHDYGLPTTNCLFFTYNKDLLKRARKNIRAILQHNYKYVEKNIDVSSLKNSFYTLKDFITKELISEDDKLLFPENNYMSFSKFKQCYLGKHEKKELHCAPANRKKSPDLVWHIIRTYIKGYHLNKEFSLEEYKNLLPRDKIVDSEVFEDVVNTIWKNWYSKFFKDFQYWDDQDLIHHVLQNIRNHPQSPVIFCDEIQDFTRIELDLIWRLSSFTDYDLSSQSNIPFVFAGDPNQTVHPTGFHWDSLEDIFKNRFAELNLSDLSVKKTQLLQNYRSKAAIIKFSNLIQRFRQEYLGINELTPQIPWQKIEGFSPFLLILNEDIYLHDLKEILQKNQILLPTSRSEKNYIKKNHFLSQLDLIPKEEKLPVPNIMNAASVKGLEYDKVVLFNFGDHVSDAFQKCTVQQALNDDEKIELIHFFNKLYVAISRASSVLCIIDTRRGYDNFWKYFMDSDLLPFTNTVWKSNQLLPLSKGIKADIENIKNHDPLKTAKSLHKSGMGQENDDLLLRAQQYYQSLFLEQEALECEAWANWYREDWLEAGESFAKLNDFPKACDAFWKVQQWQRLKEIYGNHNPTHPHLLFAKYMLGESDFGKLLDNSYFEENCSATNESWKSIVSQLQEDFEEKIKIGFEAYAPYAENIGNKGFKVFFDLAGTFYFKDEIYDKAAKAWEQNHDLSQENNYTKTRKHYLPTNYYTAKINAAKGSKEKIFWLDKLKNYEQITIFFDTTSNKQTQQFDLHTYRLVFNAYLKTKKFDTALQYTFLSLEEKVEKLLAQIDTLGPRRETDDRKKKIFQLLLKKNTKGAKILLSHIQLFKRCFDERNAIAKILKNEEWKNILEAYQSSVKPYLPEDLSKGLLSHIIRLQWTKNAAANETIRAKFDYTLQLIHKGNQINANKIHYEKLFRNFILHPFGIELLRQYDELFRVLFNEKTSLRTVLENPKWEDLLTQFEQDFQTELPERYTEYFVDIVCEKLNNRNASYLSYTFQLLSQLSEADKLLQYIKLINAVPIPDSEESTTEVFSDTLKNHLLTIVEKSINSSTQALSPDSSKPE